MPMNDNAINDNAMNDNAMNDSAIKTMLIKDNAIKRQCNKQQCYKQQHPSTITLTVTQLQIISTSCHKYTQVARIFSHCIGSSQQPRTPLSPPNFSPSSQRAPSKSPLHSHQPSPNLTHRPPAFISLLHHLS